KIGAGWEDIEVEADAFAVFVLPAGADLEPVALAVGGVDDVVDAVGGTTSGCGHLRISCFGRTIPAVRCRCRGRGGRQRFVGGTFRGNRESKLPPVDPDPVRLRDEAGRVDAVRTRR